MLDLATMFCRRPISSIAHRCPVTHVSGTLTLLFQSSSIPTASMHYLAGDKRISTASSQVGILDQVNDNTIGKFGQASNT